MARVVPCLVPRCPEYAVAGRSYCAAHLGQRWQLGLTGERKLGADWQRLRQLVFALQGGICATPGCRAQATVLHHKRSAYENEPDDVVGLCAGCHRRAHSPRRPRRSAA
jgi:5-methylcytosine-specific restriction endonuclease McrA